MRELIAILRGIKPGEVSDIASAVIDAGFSQIEVPLNSPSPLDSIERLTQQFGDHAMIGAGTVLTPEQVNAVAQTGARLIVSPDANPAVIERSCALGMTSIPGVLTPTECFAALRAGAHALKIFPCAVIGPGGVAAIRAVLPPDTVLHAVGGANANDFSTWLNAGINGFGIGSALYKPGDTARQVGERAAQMVTAYDKALQAKS